MNRTLKRFFGLTVGICLLLNVAQAQEESDAAVSKRELSKAARNGLDWLAKTQAPDGHWDGQGGQYPTAMTALAGMTMLMEGSTIRQGRYCDNIERCVTWFMKRSMPNGLIGNPNNPTEAQRYTYGHGFGLLFLASVYGDEDDKERRKKLETILKKAVEFTGNAQTDQGGWGYVSAKDGSNFDEGSTTITQLQALRAARNAGIPVKKEIIDKATAYLKKGNHRTRRRDL